MGLLEMLGLRKKKEPEQQQRAGRPTEKTILIEKPRPSELAQPTQDLRLYSDSQKTDMILQGVFTIIDELMPKSESGARVSRLQLILENMSAGERTALRSKLDELDIDEGILGNLEIPLTIEELSDKIMKSYGYTAARLRSLKNSGKVARIRDPETGKYKYARMKEGQQPQADAAAPPVEQKSLGEF